MWILVPDEEGKEPWTGTISLDSKPESQWTFELIRPVYELGQLYSDSPFQNDGAVIGLLDHQTRCTIIRPIVTSVDPGSVGTLIDFHRTRIEGICESLLTGLAIEDMEEKIFLGIEFVSETFSAWFAPPFHTTAYDRKSRTPSIDIKPDETKSYAVPELGALECTTGARFSRQDVRSGSITSSSLFKLSFETAKSLNETRTLCFGLERLFGFLIGQRGPLPKFSTWISKQYDVEDRKIHYRGSLEIGGVQYIDRSPPHPMKCVHTAGDGPAVDEIVSKFFAQDTDIVTRIHAVEFCRFFTNNLNDKFSVIMPVLEEYLKSRYTNEEERSYIQSQKKFFDYVDLSDDEEIKEFSKKHLNVKNAKAPSLSTLLLRAIAYVNDNGFEFDQGLAKEIQARRGKLFHSVQNMTASDVRAFSLEINATVALLMLHTLNDLGIDIKILSDRYSAFPDLVMFLKQRPLPTGNTTAILKKPSEVVKEILADAKDNEPAAD